MTRRYELDALRGLAALAVLAYHALATNSANLNEGIYLRPVDGVLANILVNSPLHIAWLGLESVLLFFVLSGFVLTRAASRDGFDWGAYYPSRIVRLYLPVLGAIVLAWMTYLIPHIPNPSMDLDQLLPTSYPLSTMLSDAILIGGTGNSLGVLWSLQWEVIFSLLLPIYVILARRFPFFAGFLAVGMLLAGWQSQISAASYLPVFFFGSVLATQWDRIERWANAHTSWHRHVVGSTVLILSVCAITSYFLVGPALEDIGLPARTATLPIVLAGIVALIALVQLWEPLRRLMSTRVLVFAGTISFSLYLVHLPIVVLLQFLLPTGAANAVLSMVISVVVAIGFYYAVERPAHRLARRVSKGSSAVVPIELPESPVVQRIG